MDIQTGTQINDLMETAEEIALSRDNIELLDENSRKYLTFLIDNETYGIGIENVTQIIGLQKITSIPNQPDYVKGVINLRGQIIPLMEVRKKFKKETIEYDDRTCIVVIKKDDMDVGLIVDRVAEVLNIRDEEIADTKEFNKDTNSHYIKGVANMNNMVIILLEIDELLSHDSLD